MPTVRFAEPVNGNDVAEGAGVVTHQVVLSEPSSQVVTVVIQGESYRSGDMQTAAQTITFQPGQTTATFTSTVYDDAEYEGDEVFKFTIVSAVNATVDTGGSIIRNNEFYGYILESDKPAGPMVRFGGTSSVQNVNEGAGVITREVVLSQASSQTVTVVIEGASYRAGDMQTTAQIVTFAPGQTTATFTAAIVDDTAVEGDEVFAFTIVSATNATVDLGGRLILNNAFQGYIIDNDTAVPGVAFTATTANVSRDGGAGNDTFVGLAGGNHLWGGDGNDSIAGGSGFDDTHGNKGEDTVRGGGGDDWVVGGQGNDALYGDEGGDIVLGNLGNDTLEGGSGGDVVRGGQADDVLAGGDGDDFLSGDRGSDTVSGGAGADTFNFFPGAGVDRITDFSLAQGDTLRWEGGGSAAYILTSNGIDTVINFGNGDVVTLVGVSGTSLTGTGWLVVI